MWLLNKLPTLRQSLPWKDDDKCKTRWKKLWGSGSGRNIACDNYFTDLKLAETLTKNKLTMVGMIKRNKRFLPKAFQEKKHIPLGESKFLFRHETTLMSFQSKRQKNVLLLSTMHNKAEVGDNGKPDIVLTCNKIYLLMAALMLWIKWHTHSPPNESPNAGRWCTFSISLTLHQSLPGLFSSVNSRLIHWAMKRTDRDSTWLLHGPLWWLRSSYAPPSHHTMRSSDKTSLVFWHPFAQSHNLHLSNPQQRLQKLTGQLRSKSDAHTAMQKRIGKQKLSAIHVNGTFAKTRKVTFYTVVLHLSVWRIRSSNYSQVNVCMCAPVWKREKDREREGFVREWEGKGKIVGLWGQKYLEMMGIRREDAEWQESKWIGGKEGSCKTIWGKGETSL